MQPGNSISTDRHHRVRAIFHGALDLPTEQRQAFVRQQTGGDAALEAEVAKLLQAIENAQRGGFLDKPAWKPPVIPQPVGPGMDFGAYRVVEQLGGGGMGAVYKVMRSDDVFRKIAALKVVRPECMTPDLLRRFQQERRILAELDHPNLARIIDGGTTADGLPYFVMDYVEGEHLDRYCATRKFSVEQKLRLFGQVCFAVQYLHSNHILHRDVKPSNIIVTPSGNIKLVDFGIAKALNMSSSTTTTLMMTVAYASPEQLTGRPVTPATDVYALGVILYELLTGWRPFPVETPGAAIVSVHTRNPRPPSEVAGLNPKHSSAEPPAQLRYRLTGDLDTILLTALRNEPERRYKDAGELGADIDRHLTGRPISLRQEKVGYRTMKFVKRNRARVVAAVVMVALLGWAIAERIRADRNAAMSIDRYNSSHDVVQKAAEDHAQVARQIAKLRQPGRMFMLPPDLVHTELADLQQVIQEALPALVESIRLKPGVTPERKALVARAAAYLDSVRDSAGNNPVVLRQLGAGYLALGDIRGYAGQPNLSDREGAIEMYSKARVMLNTTVAYLPQDGEAKKLLETLNQHTAAVVAVSK
jgi:tRNA A-37 threonylcarbamoyl transferase component Bud32